MVFLYHRLNPRGDSACFAYCFQAFFLLDRSRNFRKIKYMINWYRYHQFKFRPIGFSPWIFFYLSSSVFPSFILEILVFSNTRNDKIRISFICFFLHYIQNNLRVTILAYYQLYDYWKPFKIFWEEKVYIVPSRERYSQITVFNCLG